MKSINVFSFYLFLIIYVFLFTKIKNIFRVGTPPPKPLFQEDIIIIIIIIIT